MGLKSYNRHSAAIIRTPRWKALRVIAKRRDGWKCVQCGAAGDLEVDHIRPVRTHPDLAYDLGNLQTLCVACHSRKTRIEVGMDVIDPKRQAWRDCVRELSRQKGNHHA